jgi:hypothetical protein
VICRKVRARLTYMNVAVVLILVFVTSGGAYAASKYVITSTKQISPKVLKSLMGKTGPTGAPGPQGAPGSPGVVGPQGPAGKEGSPGKEGKEGKEGSPGQEGSPWTAGGTLPSGKTETGQWSGIREATKGEFDFIAFSFPIPLATPVTPHFIGVQEGEGESKEKLPAGCKGNYKEPDPSAGNLCVFANSLQGATFAIFWNAADENPEEVAGESGTVMLLEAGNAGFDGGFGTWAVKAK